MREQISFIVGLVGGFFGYFLGGLDVLLSVFATILVLDTLAGMLKAWNKGEYESKIFRKGIFNKCGYLIAILLAVQIDILMGGSGLLRNAVLTGFIANEGMSIMENLGALGIKFPAKFKNAIKSLKENNKKSEPEE